jgi:hypothetical protein
MLIWAAILNRLSRKVSCAVEALVEGLSLTDNDFGLFDPCVQPFASNVGNDKRGLFSRG